MAIPGGSLYPGGWGPGFAWMAPSLDNIVVITPDGFAMADILTPRQRSERMARVRGRGNRSTEVALAGAFRKHGVRGWRRHVRLVLDPPKSKTSGRAKSRKSVRPDFVFRPARVAVFVDGCFWHACPLHGTQPEGNAAFWGEKLAANRQRDRRTSSALRRVGWVVVRLWEHDLKTRPDACVRRVVRAFGVRRTGTR
jgi:DNA mismatch endonuclease (patch repair protein)